MLSVAKTVATIFAMYLAPNAHMIKARTREFFDLDYVADGAVVLPGVATPALCWLWGRCADAANSAPARRGRLNRPYARRLAEYHRALQLVELGTHLRARLLRLPHLVFLEA